MGISSDVKQYRNGASSDLPRANTQEVPPGYKRTEVGVIPEDWDLSPLANVVEFLDSQRRPVKRSDRARMAGIYPYYGASGIVDYVNGYLFDEDLILLGEDGENILSRNVPLAFKVSGKVWVNNHAHVLRPKPGIDIDYLTEFLESIDYSDYNSGTAQPKLNKQSCARIPVALPHPNEQRAIAAALSDVDALIAALDRLIAKKRDIKTTAMQQLLTGRTRLPGFEGEWETRRLGNHVRFLRHGTQSRAELSTEGRVKYLHYGDIHSSAGVYLDPSSTTMPSVPEERAKSLDRLLEGDLVFVDASEDLEGVGKSVEIKGAHEQEVVSGLHTIAARFDKSILADGFKAYLQFDASFKDHLRRLAAGTKVLATNRAHIASAELALPRAEEQTAIATVLSDTDAEIAALEARREKTKQIKQGMMQELLTGRTRLVQPRASEAAAQVVEIADEVTNGETVEASASPPAPMRLVKGRGHNWTFDEAVVISCLSDRFATKQYPLGRERRTKFAYLLRRYDGQAPEGFLKKAAGPYNPRTKYGGPERIAREKGYVQEEGDYRGYVPGDNIEEARTYFVRWYGENALEWLERFRYFKTKELGALTTVDFAVLELRRAGQVVTVENVKQLLAANKEWAPKLGQPQFTDERIRRSIRMSEELFGAAVPEEA